MREIIVFHELLITKRLVFPFFFFFSYFSDTCTCEACSIRARNNDIIDRLTKKIHVQQVQ